MVLIQKQTLRSMEQDRMPRNKLMYLTVSYSIVKEPKMYSEEKEVCSISGAGKTGQLQVKQ